MKKKGLLHNKYFVAGLIAVCAVAAFFIVEFLRAGTIGPAQVVQVSELSTNMGEDSYTYRETKGVSAEGATQKVNRISGVTVREILVEEGEDVKEGQPLVVFDKAELEYMYKEYQLKKDKIQLEIDAATHNIEILNSITPTSDEGYEGGDEDWGDEESGEEEEPAYDTTEYSVLDASSKAYNLAFDTEDDPLGTITNPYRFLCREGAAVTKGFIDSLREQAGGTDMYVALEIRDGDTPEGDLKQEWMLNAANLREVEESWIAVLNSGKLNADNALDLADAYATLAATYTNDALHQIDAVRDKAVSEEAKALLKEAETLYEDALLVSQTAEKAVADAKSGTVTPPEALQTAKESMETARKDLLLIEEKIEEIRKEGVITPEPTVTPGPTETPGPTDVPEPTDIPEPTGVPEPTGAPEGPGTDESTGTESGGIPDGVSGLRMEGVPDRSTGLLLLATSGTVTTTDGETASASTGNATSTIHLVNPSDSYSPESLAEALENEKKTLREKKIDLTEINLQIKQASSDLESGTRKANFDGTVKSVDKSVLKSSSTSSEKGAEKSEKAIVTVASTGSNIIYMGVPENDLPYMTSLEYVVAGGEYGQVIEVSKNPIGPSMKKIAYDSSTQATYSVTVKLESPLMQDMQSAVLPCMYGFTLPQTEAEHGIDVNDAFIFQEEGRYYVYKRNEEGVLEQTEVTVSTHKVLSSYMRTAMNALGSYVVTSGITAEDYIAFPYGPAIEEGAKTQKTTFAKLKGDVVTNE